MYELDEKEVIYEDRYIKIESYLRVNGLYFSWKGKNPGENYQYCADKLSHYLEVFGSVFVVLDLRNRPNISFLQTCHFAGRFHKLLKGLKLQNVYIENPEKEDSKKSFMALMDCFKRGYNHFHSIKTEFKFVSSQSEILQEISLLPLRHKPLYSVEDLKEIEAEIFAMA